MFDKRLICSAVGFLALSRTALAAGAAVSASAPGPDPGGFFHAIPNAVREADSGITLSGGFLHQHYVEDQQGATLDTERGTLGWYRLGIQWQGDHFRIGTDARYTVGGDAYDGQLVTCSQSGCTSRPATTSTSNRMLDATLSAGWGFSPLPHLAVIPEAFAGEHLWLRDVQGIGAISERYSNYYFGGGLLTEYGVGRVVFGLHGRYGYTAGARLTSSLSPNTFSLGSEPWYSAGLRVTWEALPWLKVFAGDTFYGYGYGASAPQSIGNGLQAQEPHSRTLQNLVEAGIRVFF